MLTDRLYGKQLYQTQRHQAYLVNTGRVFEENEAKASGSTGVRVHFDSAVRHFAKFTEVVFQVLFTRVPAEATHK